MLFTVFQVFRTKIILLNDRFIRKDSFIFSSRIAALDKEIFYEGVESIQHGIATNYYAMYVSAIVVKFINGDVKTIFSTDFSKRQIEEIMFTLKESSAVTMISAGLPIKIPRCSQAQLYSIQT